TRRARAAASRAGAGRQLRARRLPVPAAACGQAPRARRAHVERRLRRGLGGRHRATEPVLVAPPARAVRRGGAREWLVTRVRGLYAATAVLLFVGYWLRLAR